MAEFAFDKMVTGDEIKGILQKDLGSAFRVEVKKNRIDVIQDGLRGCVIKLRERDGKTICRGPGAYIPSGALRAVIISVIIIGEFAILFLFAVSMNYLFLLIAALAPYILMLLMNTQKHVKRVAGILEKVASKV